MCERFVAGDYRITAAEEHLLKLRYIHQSAHWSPTFLSGPPAPPDSNWPMPISQRQMPYGCTTLMYRNGRCNHEKC